MASFVEDLGGATDATTTATLPFDEIVKVLLFRRGYSPIITGSGFGAFRLPQNLGTGQRVEDHPTILGSVGSHRRVANGS